MLSSFTNMYFPICSFVVSILLTILFFNKKFIKTKETSIYSKLIIVELLESGLYTFVCLIAHYVNVSENYLLYTVLNKAIYSLYITYFALLLYYVINLYLTNKKTTKMPRNSKYILLTSSIVFIVLIWLFNVDIYFDVNTGLSNSYGDSANILFLGIGLYVSAIAIMSVIDFKTNKKKKYIPLYVLTLLMIIALIIRQKDPLFSIYSNVLSLTLLVMYFTIENPDLKQLDEYQKNKELAIDNIEEKSGILFKISQDVKVPITKIKTIIRNIINSNDLTLVHDDARKVDALTNDLMFTVNNVLNISTFELKNVKNVNQIYNPYNLFNQIIHLIKDNIDKKNLEFKYSINSSLPKSLDGDQIKIKQIIYSIINYAISNTDKGCIDLDVVSIVRYDICRLIITISDTGNGISIEDINEILATENTLNEEELEKLDQLDIDIKIVKKMIDVFGGSLYIKSEDNAGTIYTIILDQKVVLTNEETSKKMNKLLDTLSNKKKVLVVDNDLEEIKTLATALKYSNYDVISTVYCEDIKDILSRNTIDYIFIDDEMYPKNATEVIKDIDSKKAKVIIMLNEEKESMKNHYLRDYPFDDYLLKRIYKEEIERIKEKFEVKEENKLHKSKH